MDALLVIVGLAIGMLAGVLIGLRMGGRRADDGAIAELTSRAEDQAVIKDGLERLAERMTEVEHQRVSWQSQLHQQVEDVRHSADSLRRETGALATALRRPHVRGQWGELHLRRAVEIAGMVPHCDFTEQQQLTTGDGVLRPDMVVHLAGERDIVVDAKTPLDAYFDALAIDAGLDPEGQRDLLAKHARQLRQHVTALAAKSYWSALPDSVEFVVLFVPSESCLAAALDADPRLLEDASAHGVVLASPITLIALLRTVAHGWTTEALAEATREIHELGRELHARLATMGGHLDKVGRSLKASVEAYNAAIGSLETRVLVTARQFDDIGLGGQPLESPTPVASAPRPLTAAEMLAAATPRREELPERSTSARRGDDEGGGSGHTVAS
ncbi:MAG TPA: DNA recombination protein RmuC [Marmoricola sp.]